MTSGKSFFGSVSQTVFFVGAKKQAKVGPFSQARSPKHITFCFVLVDGKFSTWSKWSNCSKSCGDGVQVRTRSCTDPAPSGGGRACQGNVFEIMECHVLKCPGKCRTIHSWAIDIQTSRDIVTEEL